MRPCCCCSPCWQFSSHSLPLTARLTSVSEVTSHERPTRSVSQDSLTLIVLFISCLGASAKLFVWNEILTREPHESSVFSSSVRKPLLCRFEFLPLSVFFRLRAYLRDASPRTYAHPPRRTYLLLFSELRILFFFSFFFLSSPGNTLSLRVVMKDVSKLGCSAAPEAGVSF